MKPRVVLVVKGTSAICWDSSSPGDNCLLEEAFFAFIPALAMLQLEMPDLLQLCSWIKSKTSLLQSDIYTSIANRVMTQPFPRDSALERRRSREQHRATDQKCLDFPILKPTSL